MDTLFVVAVVIVDVVVTIVEASSTPCPSGVNPLYFPLQVGEWPMVLVVMATVVATTMTTSTQEVLPPPVLLVWIPCSGSMACGDGDNDSNRGGNNDNRRRRFFHTPGLSTASGSGNQ
jgi:hypothetical protein